MKRKKLITIIIITSIVVSFITYMLIMSLISIHGISKLRPIYGDEDTNKLLLVAFAQLSCIIACYLDVAQIIHIIFTYKDKKIEDKKLTNSIIFYIVLSFSISIAFIYIIKYQAVFDIHWFPIIVFEHSGFSLINFLVRFLFSIKKQKPDGETQ